MSEAGKEMGKSINQPSLWWVVCAMISRYTLTKKQRKLITGPFFPAIDVYFSLERRWDDRKVAGTVKIAEMGPLGVKLSFFVILRWWFCVQLSLRRFSEA